jgi:hypothetical protein
LKNEKEDDQHLVSSFFYLKKIKRSKILEILREEEKKEVVSEYE